MRTFPRSLIRMLSVLLLTSAAFCGALTLPVTKADDTKASSSSVPTDGTGVQFRAGVIEGQGVLQDRSTIPVEILPFMLVDHSLFFSDLRVYPTFDFRFGGSVGLGYRQYVSDWDRIFGISGWYDADNTRNVFFQQAGLSLETYGQILDMRANLYLPVGPTSRQTSLTVIDGSAQYQNDNVTYNQLRTWYGAMKGFDAEAGVPIPGQFSADHAIRVYGGGYHFTDDDGNNITGASGRVQANLFSGMDAFVTVTNDNFYNTRGFVGLSWTFGPLHRSERTETNTFARIGEHINRNTTVLAPQREQVEHVAAINPTTGAPYRFAHVANSAAPGGDGTILHPFQTIAQAQAAGRDIIFVHSNEFFTGADASVVMAQNQRILGDGTDVMHYINTPNFSSFLLPHGPNPGARPTLVGAAGNSVTLASNSEFSGFSIVNAAGSGIYGDGVQNVTLRTLDVHNAGVAGIQFVNGSGAVSLTDAHVWNSNRGIDISGGSGGIGFNGNTIVSGSTGTSVYVHDQLAGSTVSFTDLNIQNRQGLGLAMNNAAGVVTVTDAAIVTNELGSTASALDIRNSSGQFLFNRFEALDPTGAPGVSLQSNNGLTAFNTLRITAHDGTALYANTTGNLAINSGGDTTMGGNISAIRGTGVDLRNSNLNVNLTSVSSNNATVGINLQNTTGPFTIMGNGVAGSGGTISNNVAGIQLQNVAGPVNLNWMTLDTNGTGIKGTSVANLTLQNSYVQNSTSYGMDLLDTKSLNIQSSTFQGNAGGNVHALFSQQGSYAYTFANSVFNSTAPENVLLTYIPGAEGATLSLLSQSNTFTDTAAGTSSLNVDWLGTLTATVDNSSFYSSGGFSRGALLNNNSTTASSTIALTNNNFFGSAAGTDTGFRLDTLASANAIISGNQIVLNGTNGTGLRMSFGAASTATISNNDITDNTDGATGIYFTSVTGLGRFAIQSNTVNLANTGGLLDRGIIFGTVTDSVLISDTLQTTNIVTNANTPFEAPPTVGGQIFINGTPQLP